MPEHQELSVRTTKLYVGGVNLISSTQPRESQGAPSAKEPGSSGVAAGRGFRRYWFLAAALTVLAALTSPFIIQSAAEKDFRRALSHLASVMPANGEGRAISARIEVIESRGLPKWAASIAVDVAVDAPERLWMAGTVDKQQIEIGRHGQQLWMWAPGKSFGVVGEPGVPRFANAPETSGDTAQLGPLAVPVNRTLLALAPQFFRAESAGTELVGGGKCRILKITAGWLLRHFVEPAPIAATLWVREADGWPVQVRYRDSERVDALIALRNLQVEPPIPETRWRLPAAAEGKVEHVALSHLQKFFHNADKIGVPPLPTLGPSDGSRRALATHGQGRLEMRDGTRVLFLRGTPEEMGEQQGTLLRAEVRDLVERVLYGVGVGSSLAKGRWFFGEIERCQARLEPFVDRRVLREMDALGRAAGLDPQEIRLANFFPELFHCSGFALMGGATEGRRIFHGRVLDYMRDAGLERNAVVTVNQPEQGYAWVNVGYAGFIGTVTAMNDQHISMGEMGGRGEGSWDGKPMAQLMREVMEKAGTLGEAIEIMRTEPRTCEYFYVIADGRAHTAVGIAATATTFEVVRPGEPHPRLPTPVPDTVLLSADHRYRELARRVESGFGTFTADSARELMTHPVCMSSNIHSVLFAPDTLDFWVANADGRNVASHTRYTHYNLAELLRP